jgi:hypothetical protein
VSGVLAYLLAQVGTIVTSNVVRALVLFELEVEAHWRPPRHRLRRPRRAVSGA